MTKMKIPTIITAYKAPVLPSANVEAKALGISATLPENIIKFIINYFPNLVFLINDSYWELINLVWTCVTVSIATTTTIKIEVPPK